MENKISQQLLYIKEQLMIWPDGNYQDAYGKAIDADKAFILIEEELQGILNKILALPEEDRLPLKDVIQDFKESITRRHEEAEANLKNMREQVVLNQGTAKAMKAYGQSIKATETP